MAFMIDMTYLMGVFSGITFAILFPNAIEWIRNKFLKKCDGRRKLDMLCYLSKTFCSSHACKNKCERKLTDEHKQKACQMSLPIAHAYFCDENGELLNKEIKE